MTGAPGGVHESSAFRRLALYALACVAAWGCGDDTTDSGPADAAAEAVGGSSGAGGLGGAGGSVGGAGGSVGGTGGLGGAGGSVGGAGGSVGGAGGTGGGSALETPGPNAYSWDGSWSPQPAEFPLAGVLDETHTSMPALPPGTWGWDNACDCPGDEGTAIYDAQYVAKGVDFEQLLDTEGRLFGWRMISTVAGGITMDHRADNFEGSSGADIVDMNPAGDFINSPGMNLADGPDILRYSTGRGVDVRTGSDATGALRDNDLVVLGSERAAGLQEYDIGGTTVHTGPGADLAFARNFGAAAIDLGNGGNGRTDTIDPSDGDDVAVLGGNMRDFRVYGGAGNDTFIWYVDEANDDRWLGPAFFGGGGWGDAIWGDDGIDRLVLVVPTGTPIAPTRPEHDATPGSLLAFIYTDYMVVEDAPTAADPLLRYYQTVPQGPGGESTITLGYRSVVSAVDTADFYVTSVEEIQLGLGADAKVYVVDHVTGELTLDASREPILEAPSRASYNALVDDFAR